MRKLTIEEMHFVAQSRKGKCLSNTYHNTKKKLLWECSEGHQWRASPSNIKTGTWCPICAGKKKLTIEEMQNIAESRGGECLSNTYTDGKTKLLWKCANGHQWKAIPSNVIRGSWCPKCSGSHKLTIEQMNLLAKEKGGKCLSNKYINAHSKLLWECFNGHQWAALPYSIKQGTWCPHCYKQKRKSKNKKSG